MREIKFRGKSLKDGKWVYGYYVLKKFRTHCIYGYDFVEEIDPETLGQYTGLKDKNKQEIYEGDIVKWRDVKMEVVEEFNVLLFEENMGENVFDIETATIYDYNQEMEVIGNIYENPELLEVKE